MNEENRNEGEHGLPPNGQPWPAAMDAPEGKMRRDAGMEEADAGNSEKRSGFWKEVLSWVEVIVAAVAVSLFLTKVVLVNAIVPSSSMEMLISPGDRLFGNRLAYKFGDPERFDVVIFKYPVDEDENYIKRIIGLPGEHVAIEDAGIYIDGASEPLAEKYLPEEWVIENDGYEFDVPEDHYLMLGDNRNVSLDARYWAQEAYDNGLADSMEDAEGFSFVARDKILGKAMFTYWPHFKILSGYSE